MIFQDLTTKDKLPSLETPLCIRDIELFNDAAVIEALKTDLSNLPDSPHMFDTKLFVSINVPYKYLWNKQYSMAIDAWELLFTKIQEIDINRYQKMHKGTPYYFCGIAAFKAKDYVRAVFYFDAALQEDAENYDILRKNHLGKDLPEYQKAPAALFLTLNDRIEDQTAIELTRQIERLMKTSLKRFQEASESDFDLTKLQKCFLERSIEDVGLLIEWRSAATALLSYVLESETRKKEFSIRSAHGGTMEPFFLHLFKGCLLFETLLKISPGSNKMKKNTLGKILNRPEIIKKLSIDKIYKKCMSWVTFYEAYHLNATWRKDRTSLNDRVVWTAYGIRNATGHNLSWPVNGMTVDDYQNLSDDILFAIFLTILKLFSTNNAV